MIRITDSLCIADEEVRLRASRSGGPGGQKVNKVSTRMMLRFDVAGSPSLTGEQRARIAERLQGRINREGVLVLVSQVHRTQLANREAVVARFAELVRAALRPRGVRKATRVPASVHERRLESKRRRSKAKRLRVKDIPWEG